MKNQNENQKNNDIMEGYNPNVYKNLSLIFIILTVLNIAVVIYSFAKTGFGLWHAEDALSCIAKIESSVEDINRSILKIELDADNTLLVQENVENIFTYHQDIA